MDNIFNPIKSRFNNPAFKNMCEYNELMDDVIAFALSISDT